MKNEILQGQHIKIADFFCIFFGARDSKQSEIHKKSSPPPKKKSKVINPKIY